MALHRQEFEHELEAIEAQVIELFAMVAEDLPRATEALLTGNSDVVRELAERDQAIDALYPKIEDLADRELVLQARWPRTCASWCPCCGSCPSSSAPMTSSSASPGGWSISPG